MGKRFQLVLIKPSHYDDDGYVIRWWRAMIPSNSLAAVYGIAADCAERQVLGPDVAIDIDAIDETQYARQHPRVARTIPTSRRFGLVGAVRRPVEPVSRARSISPAIPRGRRTGRDRGISCVWLSVDAGRSCGRA